jgi:hypothetical protein
MKYIKRSIEPKVFEDMKHDFLEENMQLIDISEKYQIDYHQLRAMLQRDFDTVMLLQFRKFYRRDKYGEQLSNRRKPSTSQRVVGITCSLIHDKELNYADIARKFRCSRERVGQVAELIANNGFNVARSQKQTRGSGIVINK